MKILKKKKLDILNIFYFNFADWERHFIINDIFDKNNFKNYEIKVTNYDNNIDINELNKYDEMYNFIIFNHSSDFNLSNNILDIIKPIGIFYFSDEWANNNQRWYNLSKKTDLFFYQYNHKLYEYSDNCFQIPLGYGKSFLNGENFSNMSFTKIKYRNYDCAFAGQMKSNRKEMVELFKENFKKNHIYVAHNNWINDKQNIDIKEMYKLYSDSVYILIGRGNASLDCYRIYEAIASGGIPVIMGDDEEIDITFKFNGLGPFKFIKCGNWTEGVNKCKEYLGKKNELQEIQDFNINWFKKNIKFIQDKILLNLKSYNFIGGKNEEIDVDADVDILDNLNKEFNELKNIEKKKYKFSI